jgi:hypothetical protein
MRVKYSKRAVADLRPIAAYYARVGQGAAAGQRGSSRNVVGKTSARTIDCA